MLNSICNVLIYIRTHIHRLIEEECPISIKRVDRRPRRVSRKSVTDRVDDESRVVCVSDVGAKWEFVIKKSSSVILGWPAPPVVVLYVELCELRQLQKRLNLPWIVLFPPWEKVVID